MSAMTMTGKKSSRVGATPCGCPFEGLEEGRHGGLSLPSGPIRLVDQRLLDRGVDLRRHRIFYFFGDMADGAEGSADQGESLGDLPRITQVERDGGDGAGDIYRDQAFAPLAREFRQVLNQLAVLSIDTGVFGDIEQRLGARVAFGVSAMADTGHALFA